MPFRRELRTATHLRCRPHQRPLWSRTIGPTKKPFLQWIFRKFDIVLEEKLTDYKRRRKKMKNDEVKRREENKKILIKQKI